MRQWVTLGCGLLALMLLWWICAMAPQHHLPPPQTVPPPAPIAPATRTESAAIPSVAPLPEAANALVILASDVAVTVAGDVPNDAAREQLLARVAAQFPTLSVEDRLRVRAQVQSSAWLMQTLPQFPPDLAAVRNAGLRFDGREAVLEGQVASAAIRAAVARSLKDALGAQVRLDDRLSIDANAALGSTAALQSALNMSLRDQVIEFESGSDRLTANGRRLLDELVPLLLQLRGARIEIRGHTDARGDAARNQRLSLRRAKAVAAYLARNDIAPALMSAVGRGALEPIGDNETAAGRQRNRRIEFKVF